MSRRSLPLGPSPSPLPEAEALAGNGSQQPGVTIGKSYLLQAEPPTPASHAARRFSNWEGSSEEEEEEGAEEEDDDASEVTDSEAALTRWERFCWALCCGGCCRCCCQDDVGDADWPMDENDLQKPPASSNGCAQVAVACLRRRLLVIRDKLEFAENGTASIIHI